MEAIVDQLGSALPPEVVPVDSVRDNLLLLQEADPAAFWSRLLGALRDERTAALLDPGWPEEWSRQMRSRAVEGKSPGACLLIPTSGSSGLPKFCIHNSSTIRAAARGYAERFGSKGIIHAVNILPQHHVGGLLPVFRSAACGGRVHFADYRNPGQMAAAPFRLEQASLSLVPTQLRRLLCDEPSTMLLRRFALILVGGAACPPDLLEKARRQELNLAPCYGATETAAMVAAMDPHDFLSDHTGVGPPLPHAHITANGEGPIRVQSDCLLLGYLPSREGFSREPFRMEDEGFFDEMGSLQILGRADRVINTGGEKVHPEQVETAALSTGLVSQARCRGVADPDWGHRVELWVVPRQGSSLSAESLLKALRGNLPSYAVPKAVHCGTSGPGSRSWKE